MKLSDVKHLHRRTYGNISIWIAAGLVGLVAVLYSRLISAVQELYYDQFAHHPGIVTALTPIFFLGATALVVRYSPEAKGSGIPQVLQAIAISKDDEKKALSSPLVSLKTAVIKVLSSTLGVLGGASIGREGPTIQLASSIFAWVGRIMKKRSIKVDPQSFLVAGAAAGVAAAFNTPIAGIAFALEEIAEGAFGSFKQTVMLSVIIAGICAQTMVGNYLYFGHPILAKPSLWILPQGVLIGVVAGLLGGIFARALAYPGISRLPVHWIKRSLICGAVCAAISLLTNGDTAGSGYEVTRKVFAATVDTDDVFLFPILKLVTTVFSYLSGMAGGIFSPSLSIGSGIGIALGKLIHMHDLHACALMGMVAFFSGAIQAPLTGTIIVMEMTDQHFYILPFMIAAFIGHGVGKWVMPVPLYRYLADADQSPKAHKLH